MPHRIFRSAHAQEIADTLTVASGSAAIFGWLTELDAIISIIAGLVAITAGCFAIYYHVLNIRRLREKK